MKSEIRERFERLEAELNEVRIAGIKRRNVDYWQGHADGRAGIMPCDNPPQLTVDHVTPLVRGGRNDIKNLQLLCSSCNHKKRDKIIDYRGEPKCEV